MHPALMTALAEERHATLLRAGDKHRLARLARPRRGRAFAVRLPVVSAGIATLSRHGMADHSPAAACCA
jgi:hypothetical protein